MIASDQGGGVVSGQTGGLGGLGWLEHTASDRRLKQNTVFTKRCPAVLAGQLIGAHNHGILGNKSGIPSQSHKEKKENGGNLTTHQFLFKVKIKGSYIFVPLVSGLKGTGMSFNCLKKTKQENYCAFGTCIFFNI
jgi:hypothetical protein